MSKGPVRATKPQLPPPPPPDPGWRVEGPRSGGRGNGKSNRTSRMNWMRFLTLVGIVLLINWLVASAFVNGPDNRLRIPYSEFRNQVVDGNRTFRIVLGTPESLGPTVINSPALGTSSGRIRNALTPLKMAVLAPIPRASVIIATSVTPGFLPRIRTPFERV